MNKKIISGILTSSIILGMSTPIFAFSKEENVYANLENNGDIKNVYIVNTFMLDEEGKITDYGNYKDLRNLSGSEKIESNNDKIVLNGKEGKNYYQGTMQNANLPWNIKVNYYLNGKEIKAQELAGKSGALEIKIRIKQNKNADKTFFENYLLQTSLSLDTEKCKNIQAEGATIANVGSNKQLNYNILAGSEKDISIKADVTNFELSDGISFNGLLMSMAIDNFDTSVINDKTALLKTGVSKLNTGVNTLKSGSNKYNSGVLEFANKTKSLPTQSKKVQNAIDELLSGVKTMENKISSVGTTQNTQVQNTIKSNATKEATNQVQTQVTNEIGKLQQSEWFQNLDENSKNQIMNSIKETATNVATGTANNVANNTASIVSSAYATNTKNAMSELNGGLKSLENGLTKLSQEYSKMDKGLNEISTNTKKIAKLYSEINKGITELANGINNLNNKTQNLDTQVNEEIEKILDKFENSNYKPVSFTSTKNEDIQSVQFVIKTEGISIKEEIKDEKKEEEKTNLWQKFINLF